MLAPQGQGSFGEGALAGDSSPLCSQQECLAFLTGSGDLAQHQQVGLPMMKARTNASRREVTTFIVVSGNDLFNGFFHDYAPGAAAGIHNSSGAIDQIVTTKGCGPSSRCRV
jgi:hypothetical protein